MEFLCPNGHRIRCPDAHAGRAAKCPNCGVKFRIPNPAEVADREPSGSDSDISEPELTDSGLMASPTDEVAPIEKEPEFEFLCPKGHRLHGPVSLQGRPGQCPECGSRFHVPRYDEVSEEEETEQEISVGRVDGAADSHLGSPAVDSGPSAASSHPTAVLFGRLWAEKPAVGSVELRLPGGETLVPEQFAELLSQQSHGVFAVKEQDGTHALTAVAWDSVVRVVVHGVEKLPREMTEQRDNITEKSTMPPSLPPLGDRPR